METHSAIKKNEVLPLATARMDLEDTTLKEISQTEKDKYYMISLIYALKRKRQNKIETDLQIQRTN